MSSGASVLVDSFTHLSEVIRLHKHLTVRHKTSASQKYGIEACIQRIMAILGFITPPIPFFLHCFRERGLLGDTDVYA
ncbi:hypothetical protein ACSBR2_042687 [Camellia fascicularis]